METLELSELEIRDLTGEILNGFISGKILHLDVLSEVIDLLASEISTLKNLKKSDHRANLSTLGLIRLRFKLQMDIDEVEIFSRFYETHKQLTGIFKMRLEAFLTIIEERNELARLFSKSGEKSFSDYLITPPGNNKEEFAQRLRAEFNNEKGLTIRYMIEALRNLKLMVLPDRQRRALYRAMTIFFNWNIGKYQGIFDPIYSSLDAQNIEDAEQRIESIIKNLQSGKP